jgi:hypothetical protein
LTPIRKFEKIRDIKISSEFQYVKRQKKMRRRKNVLQKLQHAVSRNSRLTRSSMAGIRFSVRTGFLSVLSRLWGPIRLLFNVYEEFLPQRPKLEANRPPPSDIQVRNMNSFTSKPPYA